MSSTDEVCTSSVIVAEWYEVNPKMLEDIWLRLGVGANVDVFGPDESKSTFPTYWGPKGCWGRRWGDGDDVLFLNPPVKHFLNVVRKLQKNKSKGVVLLPDWPGEKWYHLVWPMVVKYYYYRPHRGFYVAEDPDWGTWAMYVDGAVNMTGGGRLDNMESKDDGKMMASGLRVQKTTGWRRRQRRRTLEAYRKDV